MSKRRLKSYFLMIIVTITWGAFLPIVKLGFNGSNITPFRYLLYRFFFASLLSLPIFLHFLKKIRHKWKAIATIFLLEIFQTSIGLSLLYMGLEKTGALDVNLIATSLPLFIILGGVFFLKERMLKHEWIGLGFALLGTMLISLQPLWSGSEQIDGSFSGNLLVIAYNVVTALYFLLAKKYYHKIPKLFVSSVSFFVGLITFAVLSYLELGAGLETIKSVIVSDLSSTLVWGVILYAAIFGSIIGLTAYIKGQDGIEASEATLFTYLQPVIYIPLGYILLNETVNLLQALSLGIIIYGVYIASKRKR